MFGYVQCMLTMHARFIRSDLLVNLWPKGEPWDVGRGLVLVLGGGGGEGEVRLGGGGVAWDST